MTNSVIACEACGAEVRAIGVGVLVLAVRVSDISFHRRTRADAGHAGGKRRYPKTEGPQRHRRRSVLTSAACFSEERGAPGSEDLTRCAAEIHQQTSRSPALQMQGLAHAVPHSVHAPAAIGRHCRCVRFHCSCLLPFWLTLTCRYGRVTHLGVLGRRTTRRAL
jgi:hypothetical protein